MNASSIERLLTLALQEDAEDPMNTTDTQARLEILVREAERDTRRRRVAWAGAGLAAAAALVVGTIVWWPGGGGPDTAPVTPADPPTPNEQVAGDFVEAFAAFDRDFLRSSFPEGYDGAAVFTGLYPGVRGMLVGNRQAEASGIDVELDECFENTTRGSQVSCFFTFHGMGSEELGRGPFRSNVFNLEVWDGAVVWVSAPWDNDGYTAQMEDPFRAWLEDAHPGELAVLNAYASSTSTPAEVNESIALWEQRVPEYVEAVQAGDAE